MSTTHHVIRLFVESPLHAGAAAAADSRQLHYLHHVMRVGAGETVVLFNGRDGEWQAEVPAPRARAPAFAVVRCLRPQPPPAADIHLLFAPIKRHKLDLLVEKATELGVTDFIPVVTRFTASERVKLDRLRLIAVEAAEQCRRLDVPRFQEPAPLAQVLGAWDARARLFVLDETGAGAPAAAIFAEAGRGPAAFLVGPEGGFDKSELDLLQQLSSVTALGLGPRILRSETAVLAAIAVWQALRGDGAEPPSP